MIRAIHIFLIMSSTVFLLNIIQVFADEPEKLETVVVTGMGINADKARQNAIRNAVEQVIGTYVSSDTIVQNSALIKDEILSYSGGYVQKSRIVSSEKSDDGLILVKLEALVVSTKLKRKIEALNIASKNVDGGNLFREAFSKASTARSSDKLLSKILAKYPQAAYQLDLGKPEIISVDHTTNKAKVKININVKYDAGFISEFETVLKTISYKQLTDLYVGSWGREEDPVSGWRQGKALIKDGDLVFMFSTVNLFTKKFANRAYFTSVNPQMLTSGILSDMNGMYSWPSHIATIKLVDSTNTVLNVIRTDLSGLKPKARDWYFPGQGRFPGDNSSVRYFDPMFLVDISESFEIKFDADISLLGKVASIRASFEEFNAK